MRLLKPKLQAGPAQVPRLTKIGISGRRKTLFLILIPLLIVGVLGISGYKIYQHYNKTVVVRPAPEPVATIKQHINRNAVAIEKNLKTGDLQSYQIGKLETANGYIRMNNYTLASAVLQDVRANVPENKLIVYYYQLKLQVDKHNNDDAAQAEDLKKIDEINKAQSSTSESVEEDPNNMEN